MANKKISIVYQDCPMCGDRGKKLKKIVAEKGIRLHKVSFASDEGGKLIKTAVFDYGIKTMPFYYDGVKFAATIEELLVKPKKEKKKGEK